MRVDDRVISEIGLGLLVLLGIGHTDLPASADWLVDKILGLRIFDNELGKLDRSVVDVGGGLLVVSQFTLLADTRKGRRPSFTEAAPPEIAIPLYEHFLATAATRGIAVASGQFGADMDVHLVNRGPLTLLLDSAERG